jgi:hypothetical protein
MIVPVMDIRVVRMGMFERFMLVRMRVRASGGYARSVCVLVVLIMLVAVVVFDRSMHVHVTMLLRQVQPQAEAHQGCRRDEEHVRALAKQREGEAPAEPRLARRLAIPSGRPRRRPDSWLYEGWDPRRSGKRR